jgi:hypothetical protein
MADTQTNPAPATFCIVKQRHSRYWEVRDPQDELVCITVYKKGAAEVVRRLAVRDEPGAARGSPWGRRLFSGNSVADCKSEQAVLSCGVNVDIRVLG